MKSIIFFISFCFLSIASTANIRLPNLVSNGMVLQQNANVKVWGWATPSETVTFTASWNSKDTLKTVTDRNGKWQITVKTPAAGGPFSIDLKGENKIHLSDIWLGEVWVCSGQSNMEFTYANNYNSQKSTDISDDFSTCNTFQLHYFLIPRTSAFFPQENCEGAWKTVNAETIKNLSAVAYFFGKKLNQNLHVPIGLITASWGGTPAEPWTPEAVVENNETLKAAEKKLRLTDWWPNQPGLIYNGMIAPITPFRIAGTIWYQGESNVTTPDTYTELFKGMIQAWRKNWQNDFPFYFVQIAPYTYGKDHAALLREAQALTLTLPKTGMVITSDLAHDSTNIHPLFKHEVGYRLAYEALYHDYQKTNIDLFSPMFMSASAVKNTIKVTLSHTEKGLTIKGKTVTDALIAGEDGVFQPAQVKLENGKMIFSNKNIKIPKSIQYGFNNTQMGNVYNIQGLPVAPFRHSL